MAQGVQFDEDNWGGSRQGSMRPGQFGGSMAGGYGYGSGAPEVKGLAGWLIKHRWAKTEKGAQAILLVVMLINVLITIWAISTAI